MAAEVLATAGVPVTVLEQMRSPGRKLLLAGRGGLNLTHTEPIDAFLDRYGPARPRLAAAIGAFGPDDLRTWAAGLGEPPFVGSSGRVFPAGFRATGLLRAWLRRLDGLGVEIRTNHRWPGWADATTSAADVVVLALGGASWPRSGSDGTWTTVLSLDGIAVVPLRPSNMGVVADWTATFRERFAGVPLKNVVLRHEEASARGDVVVTEHGLEGGPVYALSARLREAIAGDGTATVFLDLQADRHEEQVAGRLARARPTDSAATRLRRSGLPPVAAGLLREATGNRLPTDHLALAQLIKALPIELVATMPIERAISSGGGIDLDEVDDTFMLHRRPGTFVAGEMLDWEAPTGGYLLQATFSTAVAAATGALRWLGRS
ncbi:MAG: TIGR03862 family flavoprotein [Acidobacteria bacterium]|nr:TIGR03862 family flavoprotein [Acidobacteriota bacterium]